MKFFLAIISLSISVIYCRHPDAHYPEAYWNVKPTLGQPWPMPQSIKTDSTFLSIIPEKITFLVEKKKCDILVEAVKRYENITFPNGCSKLSGHGTRMPSKLHPQRIGQLSTVAVLVEGECESYPYLDMDEQYRISISKSGGASIFSLTVWGALRGLETFSQLVYSPEPGMFVVNTTTILDYPRFTHRGLLIDTSRHYLPLPVIFQNLDALVSSKMNVLHWHLVDDQSFPYVSRTFPGLSQQGAFNPKTHVYSQKAVAAVIEYARLRGIRVLVEFDSPGHTLSWGKSQPKLLTQCFNNTKPIPGEFGPVDPTQNSTFDFIRAFFKEISEVFPDSFLHMGGDEVDFTCWKSNPFIKAFMKEHKFGDDYSLLEQYYVQRLLDIMKSLNKSYIVWQEVFDNGVKVKPDTVIHIWKDGYQKELTNVTAAGFKTILSAPWYLNEISYGLDWPEYYVCDPQNFTGSPKQKRLVVGGEACMWGEFVDASNMMSRTWPRTAAVAERLWSDASLSDPTKAASRLRGFRCLMLKRGLDMEPAAGPGFCECDYAL